MTTATAYYLVDAFDGLEVLVAQHYAHAFPWHAHEAFTVSLITQGTELLQLPDATLYAPAGSISITHPHEVHATPLLQPAGYSFSTLYISPALMTSLAGGQPVTFPQRVIQQPALFARFGHLLSLVPQAGPLFEQDFSLVVRALIAQHGATVAETSLITTAQIGTLQQVLMEQLLAPPSLAQLARQHGLSKFQLVRAFRQQTGLTPQGFVLLRRIEVAKHLLRQGSPLVEAALAVGFYDQAHFNRFFKRFVGVSPGRYQAGR